MGSWNRFQKMNKRRVKPCYLVTRYRTNTVEAMENFVLLADGSYGHFKLRYRDPAYPGFSEIPHVNEPFSEIAKVYKTYKAAAAMAAKEEERLGVQMVASEYYPPKEGY